MFTKTHWTTSYKERKQLLPFVSIESPYFHFLCLFVCLYEYELYEVTVLESNFCHVESTPNEKETHLFVFQKNYISQFYSKFLTFGVLSYISLEFF